MSEQSDILISYFKSLEQAGMSQKTILAYSGDLRRFIRFLGAKNEPVTLSTLVAASSADIESYVRQLMANEARFATIKRNLIALRRLYAFLQQNGTVQANPASNVCLLPSFDDVLQPEKVLRAFHYLLEKQSSGERSAAARYCRDALALHLMVLSGVRQCRLRFLKLSQIRREGRSLRINAAPGAQYSIEGMGLSILKTYLSLRTSSADELLLEPHSGRPITPSSLRNLMTELSLALGSRVSPKSLYHTHLYLKSNPDEMSSLLALLTKTNLHKTEIGGPDVNPS